MYREMAMQARCVSCGDEQPLTRMEFTPDGGQRCWHCKVTAQIAQHTRSAAEHSEQALLRALLVVAMFAGMLLIGSFLLAFHVC
jgi:hypothetical protein